MDAAAALAAFALAAGLMTLTPGLDTALVLRAAAVGGARRAAAAGLGVCAGLLAWGLAAAVGLGALLAASETAYAVLRWAGAGYLIYLGVGLVRNAGAFDLDRTAGGGGAAASPVAAWFLRGWATNILNPKVGVFYVAFMPQFMPADVAAVPFSALLAAIHAAEAMAWFGLLILATRPLSAVLRRPAVVRRIDRLTGGVLIAFGAALLLDDRRP